MRNENVYFILFIIYFNYNFHQKTDELGIKTNKQTNPFDQV